MFNTAQCRIPLPREPSALGTRRLIANASSSSSAFAARCIKHNSVLCSVRLLHCHAHCSLILRPSFGQCARQFAGILPPAPAPPIDFELAGLLSPNPHPPRMLAPSVPGGCAGKKETQTNGPDDSRLGALPSRSAGSNGCHQDTQYTTTPQKQNVLTAVGRLLPGEGSDDWHQDSPTLPTSLTSHHKNHSARSARLISTGGL